MCVFLIEALHVHFTSTFHTLNPMTFISLIPMEGRLKLCQSYENSPSVLSTAPENASSKWRRFFSLLSLNNRLKDAWAKQRQGEVLQCVRAEMFPHYLFSSPNSLFWGHGITSLTSLGFSLGISLWLDEMEPKTCCEFTVLVWRGQENCSPEAQREEPLCTLIQREVKIIWLLE